MGCCVSQRWSWVWESLNSVLLILGPGGAGPDLPPGQPTGHLFFVDLPCHFRDLYLHIMSSKNVVLITGAGGWLGGVVSQYHTPSDLHRNLHVVL